MANRRMSVATVPRTCPARWRVGEVSERRFACPGRSGPRVRSTTRPSNAPNCPLAEPTAGCCYHPAQTAAGGWCHVSWWLWADRRVARDQRAVRGLVGEVHRHQPRAGTGVSRRRDPDRPHRTRTGPSRAAGARDGCTPHGCTPQCTTAAPPATGPRPPASQASASRASASQASASQASASQASASRASASRASAPKARSV